MLQPVFSHHGGPTTAFVIRCSFIIGRSGALMQILVAAANCQKIRNLEVPNPNPTPFQRPDNACKCTGLYKYLQNMRFGRFLFWIYPAMHCMAWKNSKRESWRYLDTGFCPIFDYEKTHIYLWRIKVWLNGCLFIHKSKGVSHVEMSKHVPEFLSGSHIPLSEPHNFGEDRFKVENVKRHFWTISPNLGASQRSRALSEMKCRVFGIERSPLNEIRWIQMVCLTSLNHHFLP